MASSAIRLSSSGIGLMHGAEIVVSSKAISYIFLCALYAPAVGISYRRLLPRLPSSAKRLALGNILLE